MTKVMLSNTFLNEYSKKIFNGDSVFRIKFMVMLLIMLSLLVVAMESIFRFINPQHWKNITINRKKKIEISHAYN